MEESISIWKLDGESTDIVLSIISDSRETKLSEVKKKRGDYLSHPNKVWNHREKFLCPPLDFLISTFPSNDHPSLNT